MAIRQTIAEFRLFTGHFTTDCVPVVCRAEARNAPEGRRPYTGWIIRLVPFSGLSVPIRGMKDKACCPSHLPRYGFRLGHLSEMATIQPNESIQSSPPSGSVKRNSAGAFAWNVYGIQAHRHVVLLPAQHLCQPLAVRKISFNVTAAVECR